MIAAIVSGITEYVFKEQDIMGTWEDLQMWIMEFFLDHDWKGFILV